LAVPDPEFLSLRATVIAGQPYADDFEVIWRGMSIGRIMRGAGAPHDKPQWSWSCHVHGRPTERPYSFAQHCELTRYRRGLGG
jgi:hypothetical protein